MHAVVATRALPHMSEVRTVQPEDIKAALQCCVGGVRLVQCPSPWNITMHIHAKADASPDNVCQGRNIVVVGSSLGDHIIEVPDFFAKNAVVLALMNKLGPKSYGFATTVYKRNDPQSWEGNIDPIPVEAAWDFVTSLRSHWGATGTITLIGQSAGCPKIWAVYNQAAKKGELAMVNYMISLAGAWHPHLLPVLHKNLVQSSTMVIVHHHVSDALCPWNGPLEDFWQQVSSELPTQTYIALVHVPMKFLPDHSYHNIYRMLCGSYTFWASLAYNKSPVQDDCLVNWAKEHKFGHGNVTLDDLLPDAAYCYPVHLASHQIMAAYILAKAAVKSETCLSNNDVMQKLLGMNSLPMPPWVHLWVKCCCKFIKASRMQECTDSREALLQVLPQHEGILAAQRSRIPKRLVEAINSTCARGGPGILHVLSSSKNLFLFFKHFLNPDNAQKLKQV